MLVREDLSRGCADIITYVHLSRSALVFLRFARIIWYLNSLIGSLRLAARRYWGFARVGQRPHLSGTHSCTAPGGSLEPVQLCHTSGRYRDAYLARVGGGKVVLSSPAGPGSPSIRTLRVLQALRALCLLSQSNTVAGAGRTPLIRLARNADGVLFSTRSSK